jgi:pimeloyl-ACP methyl ester carboxylesterase
VDRWHAEEIKMSPHTMSFTMAGAVMAAVLFQTGNLDLEAASADGQNPPLTIRRQGSFLVGGKTHFTETGNDTDPLGARNPGTATINQSYVEFQIPVERKSPYPIILLPGGGHFGKVYETTPDGREGWATYFVRKGLAVYNSDGVNRGASSYDITDIVLVRQGNAPVTDIPEMNRYTHELAWTQFRIGPSPGEPFPTTQFPTEAYRQYVKQLVPAWREPIEDDKNVAALVALLDRIGPSIVLTWSQSGRFGVRAAVQRPDLVKALILLEPAAVSDAGEMTGVTQADLNTITHIPVLLQAGDFDPVRLVRQENFCNNIGDNCTELNLTEQGIFGNGHVVMVEKNNLQVADLILAFLGEELELPQLLP